MKTTTGLELSPKETPQSVSVITKTQLKDLNIHSLADALKNTTGVNVTREGTRTRFESRGYVMSRIEEDGISSMMPGVLLNSNADPQSLTDLEIYDHIEVVRGATGLTQGAGQPGGTVNAVRKKPTTKLQRHLNLGVNSYGGVRSAIDLSGSLNQSQTVRGRLIAVGEKTKSFKDNVNGSNRLIYAVIDANLSDRAVLTVGALYQNQHSTPDAGGLPMGDDGRDLNLPVDTYLGADWNKTLARKYNLFAELDYFISDNWKWNNKVSYTHSNYTEQKGYITGAMTSTGVASDGTLALSTTNRLKSRNDNKGHQFSFQSNLTGKYHLFGREHDLFTTYTFSLENLHSYWRQFTYNQSSVNVYNFNSSDISYIDFNSPDPSTGKYRYLEVEDYWLTTHGVNFGTRFNIIDDVHLIAGSRWTHWKSSYHDLFQSNVAAFTDKAYDEPNYKRRSRFIPYLGLTWDVSKNHSLYASYTQIFRPHLGGKDINGKDLKPVLGTNKEIGWKADWFGDNSLNTALALFRINETNRSITIPRTLSSTGKAYQAPIGEVRSHGVDVEISGKLTDNLQLFAGYTFNTSKYKNTESARYASGMNFSLHTPKHMFRLYSNYKWQDWTFGAGVNTQSKTSSLYNVSQGGYAIWNANVAYQVNKDLSLSLTAKNIFDKRYYENHRTRAYSNGNYYGAPRNFALNVDWSF